MRLEVSKLEEATSAIKNNKYVHLEDLIDWLKDGNARLKPNILPTDGGVYILWWIGDVKKLLDNKVNKTMEFVGPNAKAIFITYTEEWLLHYGSNNPIPLYIGRTSNIRSRMTSHLQLKTQRVLSLGAEALKEKRKTTTNQMRDRIERMFLYEPDTRNLIVENVGLSFISLDGSENAVNRFYLENRLIGELLPLFNIDIER